MHIIAMFASTVIEIAAYEIRKPLIMFYFRAATAFPQECLKSLTFDTFKQ